MWKRGECGFKGGHFTGGGLGETANRGLAKGGFFDALSKTLPPLFYFSSPSLYRRYSKITNFGGRKCSKSMLIFVRRN